MAAQCANAVLALTFTIIVLYLGLNFWERSMVETSDKISPVSIRKTDKDMNASAFVGMWKNSIRDSDMAAKLGTRTSDSTQSNLSWASFPALSNSDMRTEAKPATSKSKRVALCMFGVIGRSIARTWPTMVQHILRPLKNNMGFENITLYIFNLDVGDALIDGKKINSTEHLAVMRNEPYISTIIHEDASQVQVDDLINQKCSSHPCKLRYDDEGYPQLTRNAFRQMYAENRVADFLAQHKDEFQLAVVTGPDYYYIEPLPPAETLSAMTQNQDSDGVNASHFVYLTNINDGEGYTNGFYLGRPSLVAKIMSRFNEYVNYAHIQRDYEKIVQAAVLRYGLFRQIIDMPFCKIRANGHVWYGKGFPMHKLSKCSGAG